MDFDRCLVLCSQHYNQDVEQFYHLKKFTFAPMHWHLLTHLWPQANIILLFVSVD